MFVRCLSPISRMSLSQSASASELFGTSPNALVNRRSQAIFTSNNGFNFCAVEHVMKAAVH
jgi:hypothetical protein